MSLVRPEVAQRGWQDAEAEDVTEGNEQKECKLQSSLSLHFSVIEISQAPVSACLPRGDTKSETVVQHRPLVVKKGWGKEEHDTLSYNISKSEICWSSNAARLPSTVDDIVHFFQRLWTHTKFPVCGVTAGHTFFFPSLHRDPTAACGPVRCRNTRGPFHRHPVPTICLPLTMECWPNIWRCVETGQVNKSKTCVW